MNTAYPEALTFPAGLASAPELSPLIDQMIVKFTAEWRPFQMPLRLQFPTELEKVFESETRENRIRELRLTVSAATGFQFIMIFSDLVFVPDLGLAFGVLLHVFVAACLLSFVAFCSRLTAFMREFVVGLITLSFILAVTSTLWLSRAPLASYEAFPWTLGLIYANTTTPLRFRYAWPFNLLFVALLAVTLLTRSHGDIRLACTLIILALIGMSYSLLANYRMEQRLRLAYLLASKEALRLFTLSRDRDHLATESNTDSLTSLANRRHFDRTFAALFENPVVEETPVSLLLLDVDFFKDYNDRYGHPAGDACLQRLAEILKTVMRGKKDFAFRYGGEEFGVLLLEVTEAQALQIAERIRHAVEMARIDHETREDGMPYVTVSVGLAYAYRKNTENPAEAPVKLLARSDQALYLAKRGGRNRVEVIQ